MGSYTTHRWKAELVYRSENGDIDIEITFEEIEDLHQIIERGPHWDTLIRCVVTLNRVVTDADLTLEAAAKL